LLEYFGGASISKEYFLGLQAVIVAIANREIMILFLFNNMIFTPKSVNQI
jgi:hypothetical protein